ncbi:response regulator [Cohnella sp. GCM10020058]|uniref:response regulator transcription factor n=1 Tax=Cohnella sp. GCM10020058 TaxID=3317330 RepID=UPI003635F42C
MELAWGRGAAMYTCMIVEDEEVIREGMRLGIDWASYRLNLAAAASDGKEALELAGRIRPDIVITDVVMKEMDGIELARRLQADIEGKAIKVIMISGHENVDYIRSALKLQVVDYLLKPFHEEEFAEVVRKVVADLDEDRTRQERLRSLERRNELSQAWVRDRLVENLSAGPAKQAGLNDYAELDELLAGAETASLSGSDQRKAVRAVKDYIQTAFRQELTLAQVAEAVHLSPNYLANLFKKNAGITVNDYITQIRLAEAKRLLREEPGLLVQHVAERIGYKDGKYFTKLFKREVGMNPSEFRDRA